MGRTLLPSVYRTDNPGLDGLVRLFHTGPDETFACAATQDVTSSMSSNMSYGSSHTGPFWPSVPPHGHLMQPASHGAGMVDTFGGNLGGNASEGHTWTASDPRLGGMAWELAEHMSSPARNVQDQ